LLPYFVLNQGVLPGVGEPLVEKRKKGLPNCRKSFSIHGPERIVSKQGCHAEASNQGFCLPNARTYARKNHGGNERSLGLFRARYFEEAEGPEDCRGSGDVNISNGDALADCRRDLEQQGAHDARPGNVCTPGAGHHAER
jgi:hypothetical protein